MAEKIKLFDVAKCTGCRGCQLACKQWNALRPATDETVGHLSEPPDLQPNTWTLIRFQEVKDDKGGVKWLFRKDGCMHCTDAACVKVCPSGALYYNGFRDGGPEPRTLHRLQGVRLGLPLRIPRYDAGRTRSTSATSA